MAGRLCDYFAALDLTAGIAHAALDLPWSYRDPIESLWEDLVSGVEEADVAAQALLLVIGWAKANQMPFPGRQTDDRSPRMAGPASGMAARTGNISPFYPISLTSSSGSSLSLKR